MEKHIFSLILSFFLAGTLYSQAPSQLDQLRIQVWADLDPIPGLFEEEADEKEGFTESNSDTKKENTANEKEYSLKEKIFHQKFDFAINRTKEIAPFLMAGMLDGWAFEYTPYDKNRKVEEFWQLKEIVPFNAKINPLSFNSPKVEEDRLVSWVYCDRTQAQIDSYKAWNSIVHPHIHGKGSGNVQDGFKGIQDAVSEAAKNAVREYWRMYIKNKPKEISGKVLLIRNPRIYIKEGQYIVDLDFFMETDRIVLYNYY